MIIIDRTVAALSAVAFKSDHAPAASRDDGAVPVAEEVEAVDLGTRGPDCRSFRSSSANLRYARASYWLASYQRCNATR